MHLRKLIVIFCEIYFFVDHLLKKKKSIAYFPTFIFHINLISVSIENTKFKF